MTDSSSSSTDPFAAAYGNLGASIDPKSIDPNFKMRYSSVRKMGTNVAGYGQDLTAMSDQTRSIDIHQMAFGVIGGGMNVAHRSVRDSAADALKQAKDVLDSWKEALNTAADNTEEAEKASKAKPKGPGTPKVPTGPGMGKMPGAGDLGKMPDTSGLGNPKGIDPGDLDPGDLEKPEIPVTDPSDIEQPDLTTPDPNDIKQPDLTTPDPNDLQQPDLTTPNVSTPDLNGVDKPNTDLASVNPNPNLPTSTTTPQFRTPDTTAFNPNSVTPRTGVSYPEGNMGVSPGGPGSQGSIARALNSGVPPMYPPGGMGGAGGNSSDNDRERGPHLSEEEGVWGADVDYTPAVLGKEEE
ncbi:hypothetical protein [Nonomuraea insulae]|uniref:Uncharacterized protein n=1 Tax=Nonomuraea insulae TaxID=1616787 RepID=A0ABW1CNS5_9ACTN